LKQDIQHYIVRAYDLNAHKLLPGRIADKTQKSWVMQGPVFSFTLSLTRKKLLVKMNDGSTYRTVNTTNWKVSKKS
jgi:hypothetical protein